MCSLIGAPAALAEPRQATPNRRWPFRIIGPGGPEHLKHEAKLTVEVRNPDRDRIWDSRWIPRSGDPAVIDRNLDLPSIAARPERFTRNAVRQVYACAGNE
jgi:hypothetical protein